MEHAGQAWGDWSYMLGMLLVGSALLLGVAMRLAALGAVLLMASLWFASVPLENNPVVDEHVVYAVTAVALPPRGQGTRWGWGAGGARSTCSRVALARVAHSPGPDEADQPYPHI